MYLYSQIYMEELRERKNEKVREKKRGKIRNLLTGNLWQRVGHTKDYCMFRLQEGCK